MSVPWGPNGFQSMPRGALAEFCRAKLPVVCSKGCCRPAVVWRISIFSIHTTRWTRRVMSGYDHMRCVGRAAFVPQMTAHSGLQRRVITSMSAFCVLPCAFLLLSRLLLVTSRVIRLTLRSDGSLGPEYFSFGQGSSSASVSVSSLPSSGRSGRQRCHSFIARSADTAGAAVVNFVSMS